MTPQETTMLEELVRKVTETQLTEKDPEAAQLLQEGLGRDPDAIYKLAQTVLVQNLALGQARAQIQQMQQAQQQPQPAHATSFLGGLLHREPAPPAAPPAAPPYQPVPYQQAPAWQAAPQYAPAPPPPYAAPGPSPAGGFLRSAATTAAGVAAGALAFEGIESLMHGFGHGGGGWGGGGFGSGGFGSGGFGSGAPAVDETVINNYYDDPQQQAGGLGEHHEHEASFDDRPEGHAGVEDASYRPDSDSGSFDDSTTDDDTPTSDDTADDFDSGDLGGGGDDSSFV